MKEIKVASRVDINHVSISNDEYWKRLKEIKETESDSTEDVLFDFRGVELEKPWLNEEFKRFIQDNCVYMKLYTSSDICKNINILLKLDRLKEGRVSNEDIVVVKETEDEQVIERRAEMLKEAVVEMGDTIILDIYESETFSQIGNNETVMAIGRIVRMLSEEKGINKFEIRLGKMLIQENVLDKFAEVSNDLMQSGLDVIIHCDDEEIAGKLNICRALGSSKKKLSSKDRLKILLESCDVGTVGMLSKFKETKGLDMFGRMGDGIPVLCRPAILREIRAIDKEVKLIFETFKKDTFYTDAQYFIMHGEDCELETEMKEIDIREMGYATKFIGKKWHFNMPIQFKDVDGIKSYNFEGEFEEKEEVKILPEFIKEVLDDHNIKYNKKRLNEVIRLNKQELGLNN